MLVLSRNKSESIHIGDEIVITVVEVRGDRVRIGIEAPKNVAVHRQEIYEAIVGSQGSAADSSDHIAQDKRLALR